MIKENINKLHYYLAESYKDITLKEDSNIEYKEYFNILIQNENKELKIFITKKELINHSFNWSYLSNPNDQSSIVERISTCETFISHIDDIFTNNKFNSEYLKSIN